MNNILTKKIQTQLSNYFLKQDTEMTRPETRCLKEMVLAVLKSKSVFVNQIAASLRESLKLKALFPLLYKDNPIANKLLLSRAYVLFGLTRIR